MTAGHNDSANISTLMQKGPWTMDDAKPVKPEPQGELFVIDGSNVCHWYKHHDTGRTYSSVRPLLLLLCEIREHGDDFYCVFDHTIGRRLASPKEPGLVTWLLKNYPKHFTITAVDSRADPVILHYANKNNCRIITNDRYKKYFKQFAWLTEKYTPRLVQGNYHQSGLLTLEKLSYGYMELNYSAWTRDYVHRLEKCLAYNYDWRTAQTVVGTGSTVEPSAVVAKGAKEIAAVAAPTGKASHKALSKTAKPKRKSAPKTVPASGRSGKTIIVSKRSGSTKPKVKARRALLSRSKSNGNAKTIRPVRKKSAKPKSRSVKKRRAPTRSLNFIERLVARLL